MEVSRLQARAKASERKVDEAMAKAMALSEY